MTDRTTLTPGRLYAQMSVEFQESRARSCIGCIMPMVCVKESEGAGPNWGLEAPLRRCTECAAIAARIFERYSALYDVRDPTHSAAGCTSP